ncbi:MAG: amino acid transporter, partial [Rhodococcus sp. (in: high G+C Gram-positive bacteria)]
MSIAEPPPLKTQPSKTQNPLGTAKGLNSGALGLIGNTVIGLSSVAPAYSLAAT